jgi:ribonuclease D
MLDYARFDTHYLLSLRERLDRALNDAGYREEAQEEFERLTRLRAESAADTLDPMAFWRVKGAFELPPARAAVLSALYAWREAQAAANDQPPFKVMSEAALLALVKHTPSRQDELTRVAGLSPLQVQRYGRAILQAIRHGAQQPPPARPSSDRDPDPVKERYERLHAWRKERARKRGVESDVIVPRSVLRRLAVNPPETLADLESVADLGPWRRCAYGEELLLLLASDTTDNVP